MTHLGANTWAIKDDKSILASGLYYDMIYKWDHTVMAENYFIEKYGQPKIKSMIIKKYFGTLQLIQVIDEMVAKPMAYEHPEAD